MSKANILCLVPLPPPVTGASAASQAVVDHLKANHDVVALSYQKNNLLSGVFTISQVFRVLRMGLTIIIHRMFKKRFDHAYLVISSTLWGNIRDLFFLMLIGRRLRCQMVVHLHGANIDRYLQAAPAVLRVLNRRLLGEVKSAIVLGETFQNIFSDYISPDRVFIVKNYFEPLLLIPEDKLAKKFRKCEKTKILFLSNLIKEKGYELLLDAFLDLPNETREKTELHFVGAIKHAADKKRFLDRISEEGNVIYHGPLSGTAKREMLWDAHLFCLPTYYVYEGQPISILEAYAAGCVVVTSNNGGIRDIFTDGRNGLLISENLEDTDAAHLANKLETIISNVENYAPLAAQNRAEAVRNYQKEIYEESVERIIVA